ncbi:osmoprotectant ABC transporter substrate-binding protein [Alicyclobacillus cellulosilyticus]|uniref:Osmoprotectant ABC transporter substrate-binding protein n=1 Tax=Alicyclobacillus cellulosilyticus TaxID=1003997 RepID=A0A917K785_9BACL|nr:glycine betaine ABC transporter substrate-binding protein [Alicyclobacillus cellulosilyticus]GGJ03598.1 osmoprotectant ABC transporter substrate-binding protein [Alicyclobacillus cellulosilyticus]
MGNSTHGMGYYTKLFLMVAGTMMALSGCGLALGTGNTPGEKQNPSMTTHKATRITIAAQDFSEPLIDDYILAEYIQAKTPLKVTVKSTSGASGLLHSMMLKNNIQMFVGYDGTEFTGPLGQSYTGKFKGRPDLVSQYVVREEKKRWNIWVSPALGYEDTYALAVLAETAKKDHLSTVSSAVHYAKNWVLATDNTFQVRKGDGLTDFEQTYGIHFKQVRAMTYDLMYPALAKGAVDAAMVYSTDGRLKKLHEVPLTDDKAFFPPYHAVVLINGDVESAWHLGQILKPLWGAISTAEQTSMNYEVDVLKKDPKVVAHEFLIKHGFLKD